MKLRIRGNTVRVRLTQSEVSAFAVDGFVEDITDFGQGQILICSLASADAARPNATFINGTIQITVPSDSVSEWALSNRVEITGQTETLSISIEKDFKCLMPRVGDDDHDTFPHPRESDSDC